MDVSPIEFVTFQLFRHFSPVAMIMGERVFLGLSPLPVTVANEGLRRDRLKKCFIILLVSVTGQGDNPK